VATSGDWWFVGHGWDRVLWCPVEKVLGPLACGPSPISILLKYSNTFKLVKSEKGTFMGPKISKLGKGVDL
jgi:hypothetical protein